MWYSGSDREKNEYHRIGYAESNDGVSWERMDGPVLVPPDPMGYYTTPAILRDAGGEVLRQDGLYKMWITGHNLMCDLRLATSPDGIRWRLYDPEPLSEEVYCPTVLFDDGIYKMWYTYLDGDGDGDGAMVILYATSADGLSWTKHPENPVLRSSENWEHRNVLYPFVLKRGGLYEMYYTTFGEICEIGLALSEDGVHWQKGDSPILSPDPESAWESIYCSNASVLVEPEGRDKMYYASRIDLVHRYFAIGLAVAPAAR